ncbi:MAG TPA: AMP-binding protein, partial [Geminicoccaceae bacterium]|nr:AMP-binding protein [Geminicoccaceae bacterium]
MAAPDLGSNLLELFERTAKRRGAAPFLWAKREGAYRPWSWQQVAREAHVLARALRARGVGHGDRVLLVSENRPEWAISDLAIMAAGGVTVPAYTTNTTATHAYLLNHSEAIAAVVSTDRLARRLLPALAQAPAIRFVIAMEPLAQADQLAVPVLSWSEALALGETATAGGDPARTLSRDDLACFIYTSGTGGDPKGVMLTHGNIVSNVAGACAVLEAL